MRDLIDIAPPQQTAPAQPTPSTSPSTPVLPGHSPLSGLPNRGTPPSAITGSPTGLPWGISAPLNTPSIVINSELSRTLKPSSSTDRRPSVPITSVDLTQSAQQIVADAVSVFEEATEDEQERRELQYQRQQAEQIVDSKRREEAMQRVERSELAFNNRLTRRQTDEVGADVFDVPRLKEQYLKEGWCQLFDGHTQTGWNIQHEGPYAGGQFMFGKNREIASNPYYPGLIYTTMPFGDLMLRFDFCAEKDSEVFLLLKTPPNPADLNRSCYTFILNSTKSNRPRGILLNHHGLSFAELRTIREINDLSANANETEEVWHTVFIKCEGSDLQFGLNSRTPMTYFDPKPLLSGHIAFLVAKGNVRFRNILWRPLPAIPIFDTANKDEIPWSVSERGELEGNNMTKFRLSAGTVESKDVFDNFILQMQYYQGMPSGKSSLFVRSLPQEKKQGYEISLQNFPKRQDREAVVGVDAGAFRQIKDARYVRTQDLQWTYLTVSAVDRQLQTWVNGIPVCEIQDRRSVQANSLSGPFLQPGSIRWSVPLENIFFEFQHLTLSPISVSP